MTKVLQVVAITNSKLKPRVSKTQQTLGFSPSIKLYLTIMKRNAREIGFIIQSLCTCKTLS